MGFRQCRASLLSLVFICSFRDSGGDCLFVWSPCLSRRVPLFAGYLCGSALAYLGLGYCLGFILWLFRLSSYVSTLHCYPFSRMWYHLRLDRLDLLSFIWGDIQSRNYSEAISPHGSDLLVGLCGNTVIRVVKVALTLAKWCCSQLLTLFTRKSSENYAANGKRPI